MFDEMKPDGGTVRSPYQRVSQWIEQTGLDMLRQRSAEAEAIFRRIGITFAVYGEGGDRGSSRPPNGAPSRAGSSSGRGR